MLSIGLLAIYGFLFSIGSAQTTSSTASSSPSSTSSAAISTHTVSVGAAGLVFTPDQLTAAVGDIIEFRFYPQNHSVARAAFKSPCIPYEDVDVNKEGFWSGFHPLAVVLNDPPKFQVRVNDTEPIFFYCSAPGACIDDGMIGVINANDTETFDTQLAFAKNSSLMFSPGQYFPAEVAPSSTPNATPTPSASTTTTITPVPTSTTSTATSEKSASSNPSSLSGGAIAGITIGGAVVLLVAATLLYLCGRQRTLGEMLRMRQVPPPPAQYMPGHISMASTSTNYPPKVPQFDVNVLEANARRYSGQGGYDRSATETESYRSRSPPVDDMRDMREMREIREMREMRDREMMIPPPLQFSPTTHSSPQQQNSPLSRRPVPSTPSQTSPVSPRDEHYYQPLHLQVSIPQRTVHQDSQRGPHELGTNEVQYMEYVTNPSDQERWHGHRMV